MNEYLLYIGYVNNEYLLYIGYVNYIYKYVLPPWRDFIFDWIRANIIRSPDGLFSSVTEISTNTDIVDV